MSKILNDKGYAHALIGGLAVNRHGYLRATSDVDFLVTGDAEYTLAGDALGGEVRGKSVERNGVTIDFLFPSTEEHFLETAIRSATGAVPVIPKATLVYMKLSAGRMKDTADVVELLKRGKLNPKEVATYLRRHRPDLVEDFLSLVSQAKLETD